jgi:dipeptide/tripeptide permease
VQDNSVSILWQVPQIAIITAAEILFSITGYEFAYSQSAPTMKSLVQACWLLTTSIGDSIIVVVALVNISDMAVQLLFFSGRQQSQWICQFKPTQLRPDACCDHHIRLDGRLLL